MSDISGVENCTTLQDVFTYVAENGYKSKSEIWSKRQPLMIIIRDNLPECISKIVGERIDNYEVVSRSGYCGKWCRIMFAAILSKKYSRGINGQCSPSKGFYPCYLFSEDLKEVYLAYMIASGNKSENRMRRIVKDIRSLDIFDGYEVDSSKMLLG